MGGIQASSSCCSTALGERTWKEGETLPLSLQRTIPSAYLFAGCVQPCTGALLLFQLIAALWLQGQGPGNHHLSQQFQKESFGASSGQGDQSWDELRLQDLCCSDLGWVISLVIVRSVPSQRVKLVWFNLNDLIPFFFFSILHPNFKITLFWDINCCYIQAESGWFISSNLKQ